MQKKMIPLVLAVMLCIAGLSPAYAGELSTISAAYSSGIVTVTGSGFSKHEDVIVRIVNTASKYIVAMNQVRSDANGSLTAEVTTGTLSALQDYAVYANTLDGTLAGQDTSLSGSSTNTGHSGTSGGTGGTSAGSASQSTIGVNKANNRTTLTVNFPAGAKPQDSDIKNIIKSAEESGSDLVELKFAGTDNSANFSASVGGSQLKALSAGSEASVKIGGSTLSIALSPDALDSLAVQAADSDVTFSMNELSSESIKSQYPDYEGQMVYDISVAAGGRGITSFDGGEVTIALDYKLKKGENPSCIVVNYLSSSGKILMANCVYDPVTETISFASDHLSLYEVGYHPGEAFTDISGWYVDYVNYLSSHGIMNGSGNGTFHPEERLTRAELVKILANLSGASLGGYTTSTFRDVKTTDWYFGAVEWAYDNGIALGSEGRFGPDDKISRQDLTVMLSRYAKLIGFKTPVITEGKSFTDNGQIAAYAADAVSEMQKAEIISGFEDGSFGAAAGATRGQVSKMIAVFMQETILY